MRSNRLLLWSALMVLVLFVACANTNLEEYKSKSTDEEKIIQVMTRTQKAWNNSDEESFTAEFCSEGQFAFRALGTNRGDVRKVTKNEIPDRFDSLHTNMGDFDIKNPKISINGDSAIFASKKFYERYRWPVEISLLQENEEWCIKGWDFNLFY